MPDDDGKSKSTESDPEQLNRLLELELMQKRAAWKQASARHRAIKSISLLFLFIIIAAALVGFFFVFSRVNEERSIQREKPVSSESAP